MSYEYRLKMTDEQGEHLKGLADRLGMTILGVVMSGIRKMEMEDEGSVRNIAIEVVNEMQRRGLFTQSMSYNKPVEKKVSSSFFD